MNTIEQPITRREGVKLLSEMSLIEYALEAAICEDQGGPMTSSPTQRRNVSNTLRGLAAQFETLADVIDPLMDGQPPFRVGFEVGDVVRIGKHPMLLVLDTIEPNGCVSCISPGDAYIRYNATLSDLSHASDNKQPADGEDTTSTPPAGA